MVQFFVHNISSCSTFGKKGRPLAEMFFIIVFKGLDQRWALLSEWGKCDLFVNLVFCLWFSHSGQRAHLRSNWQILFRRVTPYLIYIYLYIFIYFFIKYINICIYILFFFILYYIICAFIYIHIYIYICVHIYIYMYIHRHIHMNSKMRFPEQR